MKKCNLNLTKSIPFLEVDGEISAPIISLTIGAKGMKKLIKVNAIIDTGSDYPLLISKSVRERIKNFIEPIGEDYIIYGEDILCDVYEIYLKIDKWYIVKAYFPKDKISEDIVGMPLISKFNVCIRGKNKECFLAE